MTPPVSGADMSRPLLEDDRAALVDAAVAGLANQAPQDPQAFEARVRAIVVEHLGVLIQERLFVVAAALVDPRIPRAVAVRPVAGPMTGPIQDAPTVLALDTAGRQVVVEIARVLDEEALMRAMTIAGRSANRTRADLAQRYGPGPAQFHLDVARFYDTVPLSDTQVGASGTGIRLVIVCGEVDPKIHHALQFLRHAGSAIDVVPLTWQTVDRVAQHAKAMREAAKRPTGEAPQASVRDAGPSSTTRQSSEAHAAAARDATAAREAHEREARERARAEAAATAAAADAAFQRAQQEQRAQEEQKAAAHRAEQARRAAMVREMEAAREAERQREAEAARLREEAAARAQVERAERAAQARREAEAERATQAALRAQAAARAAEAERLEAVARAEGSRTGATPAVAGARGAGPAGAATPSGSPTPATNAAPRAPRMIQPSRRAEPLTITTELPLRPESRPLPRTSIPRRTSEDKPVRKLAQKTAALQAAVTGIPVADVEDGSIEPIFRDLRVLCSEITGPVPLVWSRERRGQRHEAVLHPTGVIEIAGGGRYRNPSKAAVAVSGSMAHIDGWAAWRFGDNGPTLAEAWEELFGV